MHTIVRDRSGAASVHSLERGSGAPRVRPRRILATRPSEEGVVEQGAGHQSGALQAKYGARRRVKAIEKAVKALATVDAERGFATALIYLDGASLGSARVTDPADPAENKAAVDAVARKHRPEYLVDPRFPATSCPTRI